jgi:hypothetical protein
MDCFTGELERNYSITLATTMKGICSLMLGKMMGIRHGKQVEEAKKQ